METSSSRSRGGSAGGRSNEIAPRWRLDRIDAWIAEGVIGGPEPNAADYQLAPSVRLLMSFDDVRPFVEGRPCGEMAMRVVPDFPGRTPQVAPPEWLEGLRR